MGKPDAHRGRGAAGPRGRPGRLRPRPPVGPRHPHRRAGPVALRRPAPAPRAGPRRSSDGRGCSCSTTRCPRSTSTPRRRPRPPCARCSRGAPCSSSSTARRRWRWRSARSSSTRAASSPSAPTTTCSTPSPATAPCCPRTPRTGGGGARMTSVEPDEVHDIDPDAALDLTGDELVDEWRGVNVEDVEEVTGGLAGLLRSRSRALLSDLMRPHHRAARAVVAADRGQPSPRAWPCPGSSSAASTTASPRCSTAGAATSARCVTVVVLVLATAAISAVTYNALPADRGSRRAGRRPRHPRAPVPPLPAAEHVVPRALHVGPGDLAPDVRRRGHRRPARPRAHQPDHLGTAHRRHRRRAAADGPAARAGEPGLVPDPLRDDARLPQSRRAGLPGHPRGGRAGDRPLRREPRRDPRRPRLPARAPQPGDLRAPRRPLPARQQLVGSARRRVRTRRAARRPADDRARAAGRLVPGARRRR